VANVVVVGSLANFWAALSSFQLIVHLPMLNVKFPANAQKFFETILKLATFKFFRPKEFLDLVDGQIVHRESNNDVMNPLFSEVGYRYTNSQCFETQV
jgi:hypothetical protein